MASKVEWALRFSRSPSTAFTDLSPKRAPRPNETIVVDAVRLTNLVEVERINESFVPGLGYSSKRHGLPHSSARTRHSSSDAPGQARLLSRAFGPSVPVSFSDLTPLITQFLPGLAGKSLLRIQQGARSTRSSSRPPSEIDTLVEIFNALVLAREQVRLAPAHPAWTSSTLGTLADLMPLTDENRILVRRGLSLLRTTERDGLRQLFRRKDLLGKKIGTTDIAWQVSPALNSAGRMGEPGIATRLLLAKTRKRPKESRNSSWGWTPSARAWGNPLEAPPRSGKGVPGTHRRPLHHGARRAHPEGDHRHHGLPSAELLQGTGHRHRRRR